MDSFRTEVCAALAATRFLQIYYEHWNSITTDQTLEENDQAQATNCIIASINIITDSASMIKKLDKMNEYPGAARSMVMDADFDVLSALHTQLNWFPKRPRLQWVPSHQDDDTDDISTLTPAAQLNIHADELATLGLQNLLPSPMVPMDPTTHVQLHHATGTITKKLMPTVRSFCQIPALKRYYLRNFKWTRHDYDNIDWMLFAPVYTKHSKKNQAFTHKYAMRKLPTGSRMERNGGNEESQCSTCRQAHEDDDHLFQCPKRPAYRKKILEALNTIKKGMCPTLYYLFSNSILNYIDGHDRSMASHPLIAPDPNTLDEYNTLLTQQARIGWDHLLRGKISVLWRVYQRQYECQQRMQRRPTPLTNTQPNDRTNENNNTDENNNSKPKPTKKRKTDRFQQFLHSAFLAARKELWIDRCDDRHRRVEGNCIALDTKVDRDVEDLYSKYDKTGFDDRKIFYELTLEERLRLPTYRKQQWIKRWKQNIGTSIIRATNDTTRDTTAIYKYFNCANRPKMKINRRRLQAQKRTYQRQRASMPLESKLYTFTGVTKRTTKSTSKKAPELIPPRMSNQPITHFFRRKIDDRYPDEWNDLTPH